MDVLFASTFFWDGTIEGPILERYEAAVAKNYDEDEGEKEEAFFTAPNLVFDAREYIFARLAPPIEDSTRLPDLHSVLCPETFFFQFITVHGKGKLAIHEDP